MNTRQEVAEMAANDVVGLAVIRDGRLLLVRGREPYWILPGGKLKEGETELDCLTREIAEELAVEASIEKCISQFEGKTPSTQRQVTVSVYIGTINDNCVITPCREIVEAEWFTRQNPPTLSSLTQQVWNVLIRDGYL